MAGKRTRKNRRGGVKARRISRSDALSYSRLLPNGSGVTHIAEVNGPGAYERRYAQAQEILQGTQHMGMYDFLKNSSPHQDFEPGDRPRGVTRVVGRTKKKRSTTKKKRSTTKKKRSTTKKKRSTTKKKKKKRSTTKKSATKKRSTKSTASSKTKSRAKSSTKGKKMAKRKMNAGLKAYRRFYKKRRDAGDSHKQAIAAWNKKKKGKKKGKKTRKPRRKPSTRQVLSYTGRRRKRRVYATRKKTKSGKTRLKKWPLYKVLGYSSPATMRKAEGTPAYEKKLERIAENRWKAAEKLDNAAKRELAAILKGRSIFVPNKKKKTKKRKKRRSYRKNASGQYKRELMTALKFGGVVAGGFMGHRISSNLLSTYGLSRIEMFSDGGEYGSYRKTLSSVAAALVGVPVAITLVGKMKGVKSKTYAATAAAGVMASALFDLITAAAQKFDTTEGQKIAGALANYPNAPGYAYNGMGAYYTYQPHQQLTGFGEYYGADADPNQWLQATAGMGAAPQMLTQAAAGMGAAPQMLTQAAAGMGEMGEYYATPGALEGIGEYETVDAPHSMGYTDEGIYPNLHSAEQSMNIAEAAAGFGSVGLESMVDPIVTAEPIPDEPGGSRAGIMSGRDGIFG